MHFESLDARRLFATGFDPTFANAGTLVFPKKFTADIVAATSVTSAENGSIFVSGTIDDKAYVAKYDDRGHLIKKFGHKGFAWVPYGVSRMAYDAGRGLLYVAVETALPGTDHAGLGSSRTVVYRLQSRGRVDKTYGQDGLFSYSYVRPAYAKEFVLITPEAINLLADGSVVLAVDRVDMSAGPASNQDLALIKLRPDGRRDKGYGVNGVAQVLTGSLRFRYDGDTTTGFGSSSRGFFSDVQTNRRGVTTAVIRYADGFRDYQEDDPISFLADTGKFSIKSRTVTARGVVKGNQAHSWAFVDTPRDSGGYGFEYAGWDGHAIHVLAAGTGTHGYAAGKEYLYTLTPGQRPAGQLFDPNGVEEDSIFSMTRSSNGTYAVVDVDSNVIRLNADFSVDPAFGFKGAAHATSYGGFSGIFHDHSIYTDNRGRVLGFQYNESADTDESRYTLIRID